MRVTKFAETLPSRTMAERRARLSSIRDVSRVEGYIGDVDLPEAEWPALIAFRRNSPLSAWVQIRQMKAVEYNGPDGPRRLPPLPKAAPKKSPK